VTERDTPRRALRALTAAALALPGMTAASAAEPPSFSVEFGHYEEGKRDLDGQSYSNLKLKPLEVDSFSLEGMVPITGRTTFKGHFAQDSWSGATPVVSLPSAAVAAQLLSGASSPNFYYVDANDQPVVVDFNDYDPDTNTYGFAQHPGLVHIMASASPETRRQWDGAVSHEWDNAEASIGAGVSNEHDYLSRFASASGKVFFNRKLTTLNWGVSATRNRIRASIAANSAADTGNHTDQIRDYHGQPTIFAKRKDYAANFGVTQVLNQNGLVQADVSYTRSSGFLENPYKAALLAFDDPDGFVDGNGLRYIAIKGSLEQRPDLRNQWAFNLRFAQHIAPTDAALHLNYRYYRDDWGIRAHTAEISLDQPLAGGWLITPGARYYSQTAASFYAPFFLFHEAYPAHPGGPLDRTQIPLKYFSSDERLSAFGALSGSLAVQKSLANGLALHVSYEYYVHKGDLKLGGGGEPGYADFHSPLVSAGLVMDLAKRQDALFSTSGAEEESAIGPQFLTVRPAATLLPDIQARAGAISFSAAYSGTSAEGLRFHGHRIAPDDLIANACGPKPCTLTPLSSNAHEVDFTIAYALTPRLTLIAEPSYVDRTMTLVRADSLTGAALVGPIAGGPDGSGRHSTSEWGDTRLLSAVNLVSNDAASVELGAGVSVPTGQAGRTLNSKTDFVGYGLQTGSGTWDAIAALDVEAHSGPFTAGMEFSGVERFHANRFGYRLGNAGKADVWLAGAATPWLSLSGRLQFTAQGRIRGGYKDHLETNVPFTELQQVDYDANGDGVVDSQDVAEVTVYRDALVPHVVASADDLPANQGGRELDAGVGVNLHPTAGPWKADRLSIEWLQPVSSDLNGYQLARHGTINARVTIAL